MNVDLHTLVEKHLNDEFLALLNSLALQLEQESFTKLLNNRNGLKYSLLHTAIFSRNVEAARYLICETDFNVNVKCYGTPCLHLLICSSAFPGCEQLWTDIFRKLLSKVDLMSRDDQGASFVHLLCEFDMIDFMKDLIEVVDKSIVSQLFECRDRLHFRPVHAASKCNSHKCLKLLIQHFVNIRSQTLLGQTSLHLAAITKSTEIWKILIDAGADVNQTDRYGRTPVHICNESLWDPNNTISDFQSKPSTALMYHPLCSQHNTCPPHELDTPQAPPENSKRLAVLIDDGKGILKTSNMKSQLNWVLAKPAAIGDILRVHDWSYVRKVHHSCVMAGKSQLKNEKIDHLDGDTAISSLSFAAALHATGAACNGVDMILKEEVKNAFCAVRPPGHHAGPFGVVSGPENGPDSHGFCLLNNISIAAAYALNIYRNKVKRVAIIDFDVHHGNGTEETIKYLRPQIEANDILDPLCFGTLHTPVYKPWFDDTDSSNVLFVSIHGFGVRQKGLEKFLPRAVFYPGTGATKIPNDDNLVRAQPNNHSSNNIYENPTHPNDFSNKNNMKSEEEHHSENNEEEEEEEDDDDDDDESYRVGSMEDSDDVSDIQQLERQTVLSMKALYESNQRVTLIEPEEQAEEMCDPLVLDIGMSLSESNEDDGGLAYRYEWRNHFRRDVFPRLLKFSPDMIFISAGFDAHQKDTINAGYLSLVEEDFEWITARLVQIANTCCEGRVLSALEGGYQIGGEYYSTFARSVKTHLNALLMGSKNPTKFSFENEAIDQECELKQVADTILRRNLKNKEEMKLEVITSEINLEESNKGSTVEHQSNSTGKRKRSQVNYSELDKEIRQELDVN